MSDNRGFGPKSRVFSGFRRSFTTAPFTSLVLLFVRPLVAVLLINWLDPLPFVIDARIGAGYNSSVKVLFFYPLGLSLAPGRR